MTNYFKAKKTTLEEKDDSIAKEQSPQEEELRKAESLYCEASGRLQNALKKRHARNVGSSRPYGGRQ